MSGRGGEWRRERRWEMRRQERRQGVRGRGGEWKDEKKQEMVGRGGQ
jgi:hypothetical protein